MTEGRKEEIQRRQEEGKEGEGNKRVEESRRKLLEKRIRK